MGLFTSLASIAPLSYEQDDKLSASPYYSTKTDHIPVQHVHSLQHFICIA